MIFFCSGSVSLTEASTEPQACSPPSAVVAELQAGVTTSPPPLLSSSILPSVSPGDATFLEDSPAVVAATTASEPHLDTSLPAIAEAEGPAAASELVTANDSSAEVSGTSASSSSEGSMDPDVQSGDFGRVVRLKSRRLLTADEKYYLLKHHYVPDKNYKFPSRTVGDHNRKFQATWLDKFNGLVYSVTDDGGYCKFCVLFGIFDPYQELNVLVKQPLCNFKKAKEKLNDHFSARDQKSIKQL